MAKYLEEFRAKAALSVDHSSNRREQGDWKDDPVGLEWSAEAVRMIRSANAPVLDPFGLNTAVAQAAQAEGRGCIVASTPGLAFPKGIVVGRFGLEAGLNAVRGWYESGRARMTFGLVASDLLRANTETVQSVRLLRDIRSILHPEACFCFRIAQDKLSTLLETIGRPATVSPLSDGTLAVSIGTARPPGVRRGQVRAVTSASPTATVPDLPASTGVDLSVVSLCCGVGGFDFGFEDAGYTTSLAVDVSPRIVAQYETNHPGVPTLCTSLWDVDPYGLPAAALFAVGLPCQPFSIRGKGLGENDDRGRLHIPFLGMLRKRRPLVVVLENVGALPGRHGSTFGKVVLGLEELGYQVAHRVLDCSEYGVCQGRARLFLVAYRNDLGLTFDFDRLPKVPRPTTIREVIGDLVGRARLAPMDKTVVPLDCFTPGAFTEQFTARDRVREWEQQAPTVIATYAWAPLHPDPVPAELAAGAPGHCYVEARGTWHRRMTLRECARLQTFPDRFRLNTRDVRLGYTVIGNAVPPLMARLIGERIKADLRSVATTSHAAAIRPYLAA